jgi:hypothetical protein
MEKSESYALVESMVQRGEIILSDLEHLLESLHSQNRITSLEQESLLELAWTLYLKKVN